MDDIHDGRPTHLDLFSGIGGFSLAFETEGFRTIGFSEINPYACAVLKKHWPNVRNYGDVRKVPPGKYDVLTAGFPCQGVSIANRKGKGLSDSRTGFWFSTLDIIRRDRPLFVQLENVPCLRTRGGDEVLFGLEAAGYTAQAFVVGAWSAGASQIRNRVWITAHSGEIRNERPSQGWPARATRPGGACRKENLQGQDWRTRPIFKGGSAPLLCRADDGIPSWVDRIGCLGNSIIPQIAQIFARAIYKTMNPYYNLAPGASLRQLDRPQYCLGCLRRVLGTDDDPITDDGLCQECAADEHEGDLDRAADAAQDGNLTQAQASAVRYQNDPGNPLLGASLPATADECGHGSGAVLP